MRGWLFCAALALAGCSARVAGGLDETRANEALALLEERGIGATKVTEGTSSDPRFALEVARADLGTAVRVLQDRSLPRADDPGVAETYAEPSLVPSAAEERARFHAAIAGEVSRTLERIDGVVDARVHVAAPERGRLAFDESPTPARASVLVTVRPGTQLAAESVRALVVGAVDGLVAESVSVVVLPTRERADPRASLVAVGPFRVAPASSKPLGAVLLASLGLHIGTAFVLIMSIRRNRSARATLAAA